MKNFEFKDLFIFDLANNHQGDLGHGLKIVGTIGDICRRFGIRAAFKLQLRDLDTLIHPAFTQNKSHRHIARFMGTRLAAKDLQTLVSAVRAEGMVPMATPFDERSVDLAGDLGVDLVKIASCSAADWPLLDRIARASKPVIASTAGLAMGQIDQLVSFMEHKNIELALMHCVAIYPTPADRLNLNQIRELKDRFAHLTVGWSTHEDPDNLNAIRIAYAMGARIFERHVGIETSQFKLNAYSSSPAQVERWLEAYRETLEACGGERRMPCAIAEKESLESLARGVYAARPIRSGRVIQREDVYFAMPVRKGQVTSGCWHEGMIASADYAQDDAVCEVYADKKVRPEDLVYRLMLQVKGLLNYARIPVGPASAVEISHHYGLGRFREFGAVIITCINRDYCKKIIVQLPRQKHPYHFHKSKEETFQLLYGDLEVELEGHRHALDPGDTLLIKPGQWHKFHTLDGAVFEEVSTTHFDNDSEYEDPAINLKPLQERKTSIPFDYAGLNGRASAEVLSEQHSPESA